MTFFVFITFFALIILSKPVSLHFKKLIMRKLSIAIVALCLLFSCDKLKNNDAKTGTDGEKAKSSIKLKTEKDSAAYAIGVMTGSQFKDFVNGEFDELDFEMVKKGMQDAIDNKEYAIDEKLLGGFFQVYYSKQKNVADKAKVEKEKTWLEENKKNEGIKTTASGLQYKVIKEGTGVKPLETDSVTVHYEGKLVNGDVFDSSKEMGQPIGFRLNQVVKGWTEGLQLMPEGSKYILYIPSALGYGSEGTPTYPGQPQAIGPNETLIFEVELIKVHK